MKSSSFFFSNVLFFVCVHDVFFLFLCYSTNVGRGELRIRSEAPELDDEFGGKEVSREEVDDWIGGFDSEGSYDEAEEDMGSDEDKDEAEDEEIEEEGGKSLKTKNAAEAERLHKELLSADKHKKHTKQT